MRKSIISLVLLGSVFAAHARADELKLRENVPDQYVVVKGDTLWDISGRFLKQPWRWPEIWRLNKDEIKNPHWIYPGDVIMLDLSDGSPRLRLKRKGEFTNGMAKLSPQVRVEELHQFAVPSIAPSVIEPYLSQPLVVTPEQMKAAPRIAQTEDGRVIIAEGENAYAVGIKDDESTANWQMFRQGRPLYNPDSKDGKELLGYEAVYLGDARALKKDDKVTTLRITSTKQEVLINDRLIPATRQEMFNYVPHAPEFDVKGRVIANYGGVSIGGQYSILILNKGLHDGLEIGHVLALYKKGRPIVKENPRDEAIYTPAERNGLAFVFRVFDRVSYALVTSADRPVELHDEVRKP
ncbi:LysM peptidoglycan-binding domain-containing protein [Chitinivorax sp. B]|uniref:LysM peptidoglycan-binding domain-containing protein n=1 Tax=Chitinivorax sp. B TaxID=2502235 RepID=UPI0010F8A9B7|nr:LysM peptidoglycan-binding domain-containing protein [Chitinivorax sp. B]